MTAIPRATPSTLAKRPGRRPSREGGLSARSDEPVPQGVLEAIRRHGVVATSQPEKGTDEPASTLDTLDLDLRAQAQASSQAYWQQQIDQGRLLGSTAFVQRLGITRQALSKALAAQRLFFVQRGGERYYPDCFADPELERRQTEQVCKALGELPGPSKWQFFTQAKYSLGGLTPVQALRQGHFSAVLRAAQTFAQR